MPNTPALIRAGVTALYAMPAVRPDQCHHAESILSAVGSTLWVEDEEMLDAVTAISGSGPAYVFYFVEAMQQGAYELGLDEAQARQLVLDTFLGASKLADNSQDDVATLRERVTSKNGTTERAIQSMEKNQEMDIRRQFMRPPSPKEMGDDLERMQPMLAEALSFLNDALVQPSAVLLFRFYAVWLKATCAIPSANSSWR
jgi:pyrroline-5-carboxylate reductase